MEGATVFEDWELLLGPDAATAVADPAPASGDASPGARGDSGNVIRPDYFAFDTEERYSRRLSSEGGDLRGDGLPDSEPDSGSRFPDVPSGVGLGGAGGDFQRPDPRGFWTADESSGGQETPPQDHLKGEPEGAVAPQAEVVVEVVASNGGEGDGKGTHSGGVGETHVVEAGSEESGQVEHCDSPKITVPLESLGEGSNGNSDSGDLSVVKGVKAGLVWWKLPMEILKFCALRVRPVWCLSIAAALMGVVMLGRKLHKKKTKSRAIPLKISVDDKRVSPFMVHAARLNEAFSVVKRVPVIRSTMRTAGVTPWPVVALR